MLPAYFVSHGGGPWPYLEGEMRARHAQLEASLQTIPRQISSKPKAVLMISGHWEEPDFTVMASPHPPMIYDYSGFPENTYHITYPAAGSPSLAHRVRDLAEPAGFRIRLDSTRGFDHGAFVPLSVMFPRADVPVVQLSLRSDYDPAAHFDLGRALMPLRNEGVLIVGSGLSYHNLRRFSQNGAKASQEFDRWLNETLRESDPPLRRERLMHWSEAPSARDAHPVEDHLLPLMVAAGSAEGEAAQVFYHQDDFFGGLAVSSFRFGTE